MSRHRLHKSSDPTVAAQHRAADEGAEAEERAIYTNDTRSADYIVIGIQAALPPTPVQPPMKSRDTFDCLYWEGSVCQKCQQCCSVGLMSYIRKQSGLCHLYMITTDQERRPSIFTCETLTGVETELPVAFIKHEAVKALRSDHFSHLRCWWRAAGDVTEGFYPPRAFIDRDCLS